MDSELRQAARETTDKASLQELSRNFDTVLVARSQLQQQRLLETSTRLARIAQLIPLTAEVWQGAQALLQTTELTLPDALVGASMLAELNKERLEMVPSLFVTRDRRAFQTEAIDEQMLAAGCAIMFRFDDVVSKLRIS